ncbi:fimbria/pilus outer membrane usher protein [Escherichia coli]
MAINGVRSTSKISRKRICNIAVSYYRYTNDGYFSFDEANTRNWDYNSRQKVNSINISQTIFDGSLYASGSQQDYWGSNDKTGISQLGFPVSNGESVTA